MDATQSAETNVAGFSFGGDTEDLHEFLSTSWQTFSNLRHGPEFIPQPCRLPVIGFYSTERYFLTPYFRITELVQWLSFKISIRGFSVLCRS
jgi:hypothetical protein